MIVDDGAMLKNILKTLEGCMSGGRIVPGKSGLSRQSSFSFASDGESTPLETTRPSLPGQNSSFGLSGLAVDSRDQEEESTSLDPQTYLKIISAHDQPRLTYDVNKKHFLPITSRPTLLPPPAHRTLLFRDRYNLIHQRLLRNPAFQTPTFSAAPSPRSLSRTASITQQTNYRITPISNLLGRTGSTHLLLGLLSVSPTGTLTLSDPSGSIPLDLAHARPLQGKDSAFFCPGMIVLVEGMYEEEYSGAGSAGLGADSGVGGMIGGKFMGFSIGGPPCEKRNTTLDVDHGKGNEADVSAMGGFGWTDFLGTGSERAVGGRMRRLEKRCLETESAARKMVFLGECHLDNPHSLEGLRKILTHYSQPTPTTTDPEAAPTAPTPPLAFVLTGSFTSRPALSGASPDSISTKEHFNSLAALLSDFPSLLRSSTFVFVPADNDPWDSAFSSGAATPIPRKEVPALFTSRIKRAFAAAKAEPGAKETRGDAVWTSNPTRLSLFGAAHEIVVFRDDVEGRLRRTAVRFGQAADKADADGDEAMADGDITMSGALDSQDATAGSGTETGPRVRDTATVAEQDPMAAAKKLILSLLPQSHLSPFPLGTRPVHWDYGSALSLYPLPHTLVLADAEMAPFALTFEGCHVLNPGRLVREEGRRKRAGWIEYDVQRKRGEVRETWF